MLIGVAMLGACCMAGCSTTAAIEASGKKSWNQDGAPELTKKVVFNRSSLAGSIEIVDLKNALAGNLMRAQVSLRSKESDDLSVQYKFDWFDKQGMELGGTAWTPVVIHPHESKTVQAAAPDPRAHEFKLKLRDAE